MPNLNLTKVAVGCRDFDALKGRIALRAADGVLRVATRMRPRRADELVGGYLYWIVKHRLVGCNEITAFADREDGRIDIVCSAELVAVTPTRRRAHQGWRYLEAPDAPNGDEDGTGLGALPPLLYGRLAALALV